MMAELQPAALQLMESKDCRWRNAIFGISVPATKSINVGVSQSGQGWIANDAVRIFAKRQNFAFLLSSTHEDSTPPGDASRCSE